MKYKGLTRAAKASSRINQRDTSTWLPIYYCIENKTVFTKEGPDRYFVTKLIRENTEEEIEAAVDRWRAL